MPHPHHARSRFAASFGKRAEMRNSIDRRAAAAHSLGSVSFCFMPEASAFFACAGYSTGFKE
jgi:hypothetical protein